MFVTLWVLEDVFAFDVEKAESNGSREKWYQSILLKLIREDWSIAFALGSNSHSLLGIADGDIKACSCSADTHGCNTESTRKKPFSNLEKSIRRLFEL